MPPCAEDLATCPSWSLCRDKTYKMCYISVLCPFSIPPRPQHITLSVLNDDTNVADS